MFSRFILFFITLAACFVIQLIGLRMMGGRTSKSESNYFSSLGRIQAGAQGEPQMIVLGSSITGRLPDRAQGFDGVANMGCDGGSAIDVLRAMDQGILPSAPTLFIEVNTFERALEEKPSEIAVAMNSLWFKVGLNATCFGAYARPAAFVYSSLLAKKIGGVGSTDPTMDLQVETRPTQISPPTDAKLTEQQKRVIRDVAGIVSRLRERGSRCVFLWLPPGRERGSAPPPWIAAMVAESNSEWWDLGTEADRSLITLTDGVHMAAPSAARTVISLMKAVKGE